VLIWGAETEADRPALVEQKLYRRLTAVQQGNWSSPDCPAGLVGDVGSPFPPHHPEHRSGAAKLVDVLD